MKVITAQEFEEKFDEIIEDVETNKHHYKIQYEGKELMLIPIESFDVLHDVYKDWVEEPQNSPPVEGFDPLPLPVEYVGEAEPAPLQ
jgi:hypothetical protein